MSEERTSHEERFIITQATMSMHRRHRKQWADGKVCRFCRHYFEHTDNDTEDVNVMGAIFEHPVYIEGWYCEKDVPPDQMDDEGNEHPDYDITTIWYRHDGNPHLPYLLTCPEWEGNSY